MQSSNLSPSETRFLEAFDALFDPSDAYGDDDESRWLPLGMAESEGALGAAFSTERQLAEIRGHCRALAVSNEFAINGHENRINYIVGSGHAYRAAARAGETTDDSLMREVQTVLDRFVRENRWHARQQEIVRRRDRDGEAFLRFFTGPAGVLRVRFVEPAQVAVPSERQADPAAAFGIQTDPRDVETVLGYWIDGRWVEAAEIQHRKANVDANVRRGLPLFFPVRKNLQRAEKLLRNMSVVAGIQSAIAIIRKHSSGTHATIRDGQQRQSDVRLAGGAASFRRYDPGTILDTSAATAYEFPAAAVDAARYVTVLQAELRAIASRLVMPEFMLTSDASNANYASTMVAEGPAVRMFQRLQQEMIEDDLAVMRRVVSAAVEAGGLPREALTALEIQAVPPTLAVRDRLKEAQADQILVRNGAMSVATMAMRHGLDPEREQQQRQRC